MISKKLQTCMQKYGGLNKIRAQELHFFLITIFQFCYCCKSGNVLICSCLWSFRNSQPEMFYRIDTQINLKRNSGAGILLWHLSQFFKEHLCQTLVLEFLIRDWRFIKCSSGTAWSYSLYGKNSDKI